MRTLHEFWRNPQCNACMSGPTALDASEHETTSVLARPQGVVYIARSSCGPVDTASRHAACISCYGCGEKLIYVTSFKRKRNGVEESVRSHFRHLGSSTCGGESVEHRAAKHALSSGENWHFSVKCVDCTSDIDVDVNPHATKGEEEVSLDPYRLDVAWRDTSGNVVGAAEVLHTHAIGKEKQAALTSAGLAWVEVTARTVIRAWETRSRRLKCTRCAVLRCADCKLKKQVELAAQREDVVFFDARAERRVSAFVPRLADRIASMDDDADKRLYVEFIKSAADRLGVSIDADYEAGLCVEGAKQLEVEAEYERVGSVRLNFGKYAGRFVRGVLVDDPGYVRWLSGVKPFRDKKNNMPKPDTSDAMSWVPSEVREEAKALLTGKCLRCFEKTGAHWKNWCAPCFPYT